MTVSEERLAQQLQFVLEVDQLKHVERRSYLANGSRRENAAEHSWHLALMAMVLAEHANEEVNLLRVLQMVLVHDLVEIDAGDTYIYDELANEDKAEREAVAAARIFGLLPADQAAVLYALWREFETRETADARFANALDRLMPLLHNYKSGGISWKEHGIRGEQVRQRLALMGDGSAGLWTYAQTLIEEAIASGLLGR